LAHKRKKKKNLGTEHYPICIKSIIFLLLLLFYCINK